MMKQTRMFSRKTQGGSAERLRSGTPRPARSGALREGSGSIPHNSRINLFVFPVNDQLTLNSGCPEISEFLLFSVKLAFFAVCSMKREFGTIRSGWMGGGVPGEMEALCR